MLRYGAFKQINVVICYLMNTIPTFEKNHLLKLIQIVWEKNASIFLVQKHESLTFWMHLISCRDLDQNIHTRDAVIDSKNHSMDIMLIMYTIGSGKSVSVLSVLAVL